MATPDDYEEHFQNYILNLSQWAPDGIIEIDLAFLHSVELLKSRDVASAMSNSLTDFFHVVESPEKITLFNQGFVIWIVPKVIEGVSTTLTLITLLPKGSGECDEKLPDLHLEVIFSTTGIYNSPRLILKVLEYYLEEIEENERVLSEIN